MARIIYAPGCYASVVTGATGSAPQKLPKILHAETNLTTAPALGQAQLVIADPDGTWAGMLKPNDLLTVTFTSRSRQAAALASVAALGTDASLVAGPASASWSGLIDMAGPTLDPRAQYGRACAIMASSWWKLLLITTALTKPLQNGIFIAPLTAITDVVNMALADVQANTGLTVPVTFGPEVLGVTTGTAPIPQDMSDPQFQSWASLLMAAVIPGGFEAFFDETGTLHVRGPQFFANSADATVPNEELFSAQGGVSDNNLVTNVAVGWSPKPSVGTMTMAPAGGLSSIGPLPSQLQGLPRLGKRFVALPAGWILSAQQAGQYASFVRAVGMANTDQIEAAVALNGDLRVGTILDMPGINRRYYAATISHVYDFGVAAETRVSGRYGIPRDQSWDPALLNSGYNNVLGGPSDTTDGTGQTTAVTLPPLAADPDVRWQPPDAPALSVDDIDRILRTHTPPSPLVGQAQLIWSKAHQHGILPAFALAVWQIETQLGTDGSTGAQQFNPGNVGPGLGYLDWASAIGAWFALIAGPTYIVGGLHTVGTIGPVYAPTAQNPHWIGDVTKQLLYYRGQARVPSVPTPPEPTPSGARATIVNAAKSMVGGAYIFGAENPTQRTFDCSGLTQWAYGQASISIPRTAQTQYDTCQKIADGQRLPGDLVFFQYTYDAGGDRITHVGVYVGGGQMVNAENPSVGILLDSLSSDFWAQHYAGAGRAAVLGAA